tara:strand:- start:111 stop:344 length:234 start_codon:yes stop_codon:yes gene_type:complete
MMFLRRVGWGGLFPPPVPFFCPDSGQKTRSMSKTCFTSRGEAALNYFTLPQGNPSLLISTREAAHCIRSEVSNWRLP